MFRSEKQSDVFLCHLERRWKGSLIGCIQSILRLGDPEGKDQSHCESLFKSFESGAAFISEIPWSSLSGKTHERNSDIGIVVNETSVKVCKS
jgi:hypothetical protein